jgi:hypothetical protein
MYLHFKIMNATRRLDRKESILVSSRALSVTCWFRLGSESNEALQKCEATCSFSVLTCALRTFQARLKI